MQDPDLISLFVAPLEKAGIHYMITGSIASSIYGEPRNTLDIDLVVLLEKHQISLPPPSTLHLPNTSSFTNLNSIVKADLKNISETSLV